MWHVFCKIETHFALYRIYNLLRTTVLHLIQSIQTQIRILLQCLTANNSNTSSFPGFLRHGLTLLILDTVPKRRVIVLKIALLQS